MNSPTFNTLDNRFEQLNPDSSRVHYGGLGANGDREGTIANVFTDSTWPGLKNVDSAEQAGFDAVPRLASPNMQEKMDDDKPNMVRELMLSGVKEATATAFSQESFASNTNRSDNGKRKQPS